MLFRSAEREVVDAIESTTGRPAMTTAGAILGALQALRVKRLVMVSPYPQVINDDEKAFLEEAGVEVLTERAFNLPSKEWATTPPAFWQTAVRDNAHADADAYFMSCTNIQSIHAIASVESVMGRPAITSNQAALWHALRLLGRSDVIPGLGRLLGLTLAPAVVT